jgi:hypothetical protein
VLLSIRLLAGLALMSPPILPALTSPSADGRPRQWVVRGQTVDGRRFRPSDWAERLCGVLACYRPGGATGRDALIGYSPYVRPTTLDNVKCVLLDERLRELEPLAFDFVLNFARDNELPVTELESMPGRAEAG